MNAADATLIMFLRIIAFFAAATLPVRARYVCCDALPLYVTAPHFTMPAAADARDIRRAMPLTLFFSLRFD